MLNSISISVSDDESDEIAGRMRVRVRKKRKRLGFRARSDAVRRIVRMIVRYWPLLIFMPAIVILLFFELPSIGSKPEVKQVPDLAIEKEKMGNLDRPRTRMVNGVRERKFLAYFSVYIICFIFFESALQEVSVFKGKIFFFFHSILLGRC